jgi:methyl-accepting chemotaxis protein
MRHSALARWIVGRSLKARLYLAMALLGILPVLGVMLEWVAVDTAKADRETLNRAVQGSVYLERINGLVYAIVMESRGIYISADWAAAEPFART